MASSFKLHLPLQDRVVDLDAELTAEAVSPHTGRTVGEAKSDVNAMADECSAFREALESTQATDDDGNRWVGQVRSESYIDGGSRHSFHLAWHEHEHLVAERVEFEGLTLTPQRYEEHLDEEDGSIALQFIATLSPTETDRLRCLQTEGADVTKRYWPVVRVGVSDQHREMQLGQLLWSKRDDGDVDYLIVLVDVAHDEGPPKTAFLRMGGEPQRGHLMNALADLSGRFEQLLGTLEHGTSIDQDTIALINRAGKEARRCNLWMFDEVDDVNDWLT